MRTFPCGTDGGALLADSLAAAALMTAGILLLTAGSLCLHATGHREQRLARALDTVSELRLADFPLGSAPGGALSEHENE